MRRLYVLFLLLAFSRSFFGQWDVKVYSWETAKLASPDTVFGITFSKSKLKVLPEELKAFNQLKYLDLSKNDLTDLPAYIGDLDSLIYLDISKNDFSIFPVEICRLSNLSTFVANRNSFSELPECIGYCKKLSVIDLWSTPVASFPKSFSELKSLKMLDLQGNRYSPTFHRKLIETLPWVNIKLDPPCDCME